MHKKFEINRTKIEGSCQSGRKVVTYDSKSDLPLKGDRKVSCPFRNSIEHMVFSYVHIEWLSSASVDIDGQSMGRTIPCLPWISLSFYLDRSRQCRLDMKTREPPQFMHVYS